jgi:predicted dehydrogenase
MEVNTSIQKIGVIGLGKMGIMHACLLNVLPNVHVEVLCDKSRLLRTMARSAFQDTQVTSNLDTFAELHLDSIYVLTPIPSHYPIIKKIYTEKLAKNVFVEKTLTNKYANSLELTKMADTSSGINMVGYMKRFGVTFNKVKELLNKQVLGNLASFRAYAFSSDFVDAPKDSLVSKARGGVVEDLGSHVVDLAFWFFGDLKNTYAKVNSRIAQDSLDDVSFGVVGTDGLEGDFEVSWRKTGYRMPEFGITINGTKGSLSVNDDQVKLELNDASPAIWYRMDMNDNVGFLLGGPEYWRENKHFTDAVLSGQQCESSFKCALKVDFLLEQVRGRLND